MLRILVLALATSAMLPTGPARAASFFKRDAGGTSIEVHVDERKIVYLHLVVPITCDGRTSETEIADTRVPIRLDRQTGAFSFVDLYSKSGEYSRGSLKGTIFGGRINGTYEYSSSSGSGHFCWSGEARRGSPQAPEGSPVRLSLSRQKGVRFFKASLRSRRDLLTTYLADSFAPRIYMWIGGGKVYGLTAILPMTCVNREPGYPTGRARYQVVLAPNRVIRVDPRTHEMRLRHLRRYPAGKEVARLRALVGPRLVRGQVSYTSDYTYAGGTGATQHCRTGGRSGPEVDFAARRR